MFQTLSDILREGFTSIEDHEYQYMAEAALDVIYQVGDYFCQIASTINLLFLFLISFS